MAKRRAKSQTLPDVLVVKREEDGNDSYLIASDKLGDLAEMGEKLKVGVYQLQYIQTLSAEPKLEED
jgi:hypothetical protein